MELQFLTPKTNVSVREQNVSDNRGKKLLPFWIVREGIKEKVAKVILQFMCDQNFHTWIESKRKLLTNEHKWENV